MSIRIKVPFLDANTMDVTVTAWYKVPGDRLQTGELVAELTTDKATFELESADSGTLLEILAATKSVVPSGYILALLGEPGETDPDAAVYNQTLMARYRAEIEGRQKGVGARPRSAINDRNPETGIQPKTKNEESGTLSSARRIRATPRARRLAQEHGVDLARVQTETGAEVIDEAVLQAYFKKEL